jgi:hypothetical protein
MINEDSQTEAGEVLLAAFDLVTDTSKSARAKTAETFLELLGARVRNSNTRSAYRVAWRSGQACGLSSQQSATDRGGEGRSARQTIGD